MADNTAKQIVFIVCVLGFFFTLMMSMPSGFYVVAPDYDTTDFPDYWDIGDIQEVFGADDQNMTVQLSPYTYFVITGKVQEVSVRGIWWDNTFSFNHHNWGFLGLGTGQIDPTVTETDILDRVDETGNFSRFLLTCDHHNYIVYFGNNGDYTSLSDAITAGTVGVSIGVEYDYEQSILSGSDIITRLLRFQLPNVTPEINFLIGIPIYTLIGVLAFIIITMVVDMFPLT